MRISVISAIAAVVLVGCSSGLPARVETGMMAAQDDCPAEGNVIIRLERGDTVEIYKSIVPSDPEDQKLPPDSPLSKKINLTYVKATSGKHAGEYCWVSTVNLSGRR